MSWSFLRSVGTILSHGTLGAKGLLTGAARTRNQQVCRPLSTLFGNSPPLFNTGHDRLQSSSRLQPVAIVPMTPSPCLITVRGMKVKAALNRRCKDCYLIYIKGILHNLCKTHGRHKARHKPPYFSNTRIMSGVSQALKKPW